MVIIGVGDYDHLTNLTATRDAQVMEVAAAQAGYTTHTITGDTDRPAVTSDMIRGKFGELAGLLNREDRLVVFIGCHGGQVQGLDNLLLTQFVPNRPNHPDNYISLQEIYSLAAAVGAGKIILFTDACRNPLAPIVDTNEVQSPRVFSPYVRQAEVEFYSIAATSQGNYSYEDDVLKTGVFTNVLINLLVDRSLQVRADVNRDRQVSIVELHNYLGQEVIDFTLHADHIRTPQIPALYAEGPTSADFLDYSRPEPSIDSILEEAWYEAQTGFPNWKLGVEPGVGAVGCRLGYTREYRTAAPIIVLQDRVYRPYLFERPGGGLTLIYYGSFGVLPTVAPRNFSAFVARIANIPRAQKTIEGGQQMVDFNTGWLTLEQVRNHSLNEACSRENAVIFSFSNRRL